MSTIFYQHYQRYFTGILQWSQLDELWEKVKAHPQGWFIYVVEENPLPTSPVEIETLFEFIETTDKFLHQEHEHDYCGIVYADDQETPTMIKIFDPHNLGAVCGSCGSVVLPRWILTKIPPQPLEIPPPASPHWWQKFF
jgi:hypothetical protein